MLNLLTEHEVAKEIRVSLASLPRWRVHRCGPPFIKIGQLVRYRPDDLVDWVAAQPTGGTQPTKETRDRAAHPKQQDFEFVATSQS